MACGSKLDSAILGITRFLEKMNKKFFGLVIVIGLIIITFAIIWQKISSDSSTNTSPFPDLQNKSSNDSLPVVKLAKEDLAKSLKIEISQIITENLETVQWSDISLGCPKEGFLYAQVITPGYKVIFSYNKKLYEYHTDLRSSFAKCQPN